ncbi:MAG: hypothetical protein AAFP19_02590 [Bacteroidota bacterium]
MLEWAILRAGHEIQDFLLKNPKVKEWIDASKQPTVKQLEDFSAKLHVPFGYLFMDTPPKEELAFPFFRTQF